MHGGEVEVPDGLGEAVTDALGETVTDVLGLGLGLGDSVGLGLVLGDGVRESVTVADGVELGLGLDVLVLGGAVEAIPAAVGTVTAPATAPDRASAAQVPAIRTGARKRRRLVTQAPGE